MLVAMPPQLRGIYGCFRQQLLRYSFHPIAVLWPEQQH
jgi:hypothetical protein